MFKLVFELLNWFLSCFRTVAPCFSHGFISSHYLLTLHAEKNVLYIMSMFDVEKSYQPGSTWASPRQLILYSTQLLDPSLF